MKNFILFFFITMPVIVTSMDQPQLTQQQKLEKIAALRAKIDNPSLYDNCGGVLLHKFGSPIPILDFAASKIKQNPNLEFKDLICGGEPIVVSLQSELSAEALAFMIEHGCRKSP